MVLKRGKPKFTLNQDNRLVIIANKEKIDTDGKWIIDKKNKLSYIFSESLSFRKKYNLPKRLNFKGNWSLAKNHDLIFTLNQTRNQFAGDEFYLKTELVAQEPGALVFSLGTTEKSGTHNIRLFKLLGKWQADKYNRLEFLAQRSDTAYDTLTFQAAWEVNKNNTLIYTYQKTYLKRKEKIEKSLSFKGYWQINEKNRVTYILDLKNNSYFSFRVQLQTPSIKARANAISYQAGIGVRGQALFRPQVFSLYGVWKFEENAGLSFEMDYAGGRVSEIRFAAKAVINRNNEVILQLKNAVGKSLGISLAFSRAFLNENARWFLRLAKEEKGGRIEAGASIDW